MIPSVWRCPGCGAGWLCETEAHQAGVVIVTECPACGASETARIPDA